MLLQPRDIHAVRGGEVRQNLRGSGWNGGARIAPFMDFRMSIHKTNATGIIVPACGDIGPHSPWTGVYHVHPERAIVYAILALVNKCEYVRRSCDIRHLAEILELDIRSINPTVRAIQLLIGGIASHTFNCGASH